MAIVTDAEHILTTDADALAAESVAKELRGSRATLQVKNLPPQVLELILHVLDATARGGTVTVTALPEELTTSTAAKILGVSRPTVVRMIREGRIPSHEVGTHHRLRTRDVFAELRERRARQRAAFAELLALEEDES